MPETLDEKLQQIASVPVLLVATDFDGTLAPLVAHPDAAEASREAVVALRELAAMPQTHVAVVSGRALADLARRAGGIDRAHLVGSHGSEYDLSISASLDPDARRRLLEIGGVMRSILETGHGFLIEEKPASLAFHYRNADPAAADRALAEIGNRFAHSPGVYTRHGKKVVELSVVATDKGAALQRLRQRLGASAVLFLGDDLTDEDAFRGLLGPDVGIKIGPGETSAQFRIEDTPDTALILGRLAETRAAWLAGSQATPIQQHSMLSDQRTMGLVDPRGRLVWLCLPRVDSSAVFAELLGGPAAGYFSIEPVNDTRTPTQRYVNESFVLETSWPDVKVIDYLDCTGGRPFQRAGRTDLTRVIEGSGEVEIRFAPRQDFGRVETLLRLIDGGVEIDGALEPIVLRSPGVAWHLESEGRHHTAVGRVKLENGQPLVLEMRYGTASTAEQRFAEPTRRELTSSFWSAWVRSLKLPHVARESVARSALVLKALCYGPTGAIAAAATTSLPEHAGGVRNWDYRFCWPRDAAMSAASLVRLEATGPALRLLDWILEIVDGLSPSAMIAPVYSVLGHPLSVEAEVAELPGYRGSRPVRVGNSAAHQVQLDVFGPIAELLALLAARSAPLTPEHWRLTERMVSAVASHWQEPDHGIWEVRTSRRHHVHSKVMCWYTVERALAVAHYFGKSRAEWQPLCDAIADDVLRHGWAPARNAFCAAYDSDESDAAALWIGLSGLLEPNDPRFLGTIVDVESRLKSGSAVYRYRYDDGLPGGEGGFLICTTWLIEAYALCGRVQDAEALLENYVSFCGSTGLLAEEYDPQAICALGNFPQAYSHLGLINAACRIEQAKTRQVG